MAKSSEKYARTNHIGAAAELRASVWLIDQGFEVFRNLAPVGKIDLIARHPATGELIFIDVKSAAPQIRERSDGAIIRDYRAEISKLDYVKNLFVYGDGTISWALRPPELISAATKPSKKWIVHFPFEEKMAEK